MMQQTTLKISGMHCGACVNRVTQALQKVKGVEVDHVKVGEAEIRYDPAQVSPEAIDSAIRRIGFDRIS
jgi:copper chaperone